MLMSSGRSLDGIKDELFSEGIWHQTGWEHVKCHVYTRGVKFHLWSNAVCMNSQIRWRELLHTHSATLYTFCGRFNDRSQHAKGSLWQQGDESIQKFPPVLHLQLNNCRERDKRDLKRMQHIFIWSVLYTPFTLSGLKGRCLNCKGYLQYNTKHFGVNVH